MTQLRDFSFADFAYLNFIHKYTKKAHCEIVKRGKYLFTS